MATGAAAARRSFETDLRLALRTAGTTDTVKTNQAKDSIFAKWATFCHRSEEHTSELQSEVWPSSWQKVAHLAKMESLA